MFQINGRKWTVAVGFAFLVMFTLEAGARGEAPGSKTSELRVVRGKPLVRERQGRGVNSADASSPVVDFRADEPSRLRRTGLLQGALPLQIGLGGVASGHLPCSTENPDCCTFDIDCEDSNPCTNDACDITPQGPVGEGRCVHAQVVPGNPGGCDDGIFCNGLEFCDPTGTCASGVVPACCSGSSEQPSELCTEDLGQCSIDSDVAGRRCRTNAECPGGMCNHCIEVCLLDADCDDGFACNGFETCVGGVCQASVPPCGVGANCSENRCVGSFFTTPCINNDDCYGGEVCGNRVCSEVGGSGFNGGPCSIDDDCPEGETCISAQVCQLGRCCPPNAAVDDCTPRELSSCLDSGRAWYAGDNGENSGIVNECGSNLPHVGAQQLGCPAYSSGIVQTSPAAPAHPLRVGPVSLSPQLVPSPWGPDGPLYRLGDDYELHGGQYVALEAIRIGGGMVTPGPVLIELWDDDGNFIEDLVFTPLQGVTVQVLLLSPPVAIPPKGRISVRSAVVLAPGAKFVWESAVGADAGMNDPDILFVNDDPNFSVSSSAMLGAFPGVLSFELVGRPTEPPLGACCHGTGATYSDEVKWACERQGSCVKNSCIGSVNAGAACTTADDCRGVSRAVGEFCAACRNGENAGSACRTCQGGDEASGFACAGQFDCDARGLGGTCLQNDGVCASGAATCSNAVDQVCSESAECSARPGVCSSADIPCVFDGDCPTGVGAAVGVGVCGGAGTCEAGVCVALNDCGVGACCFTGGSCESGTTSETCAGVFLGTGTTCDPNCCLGAGDTGRDNCLDVPFGFAHGIPVMIPGDPPIVLTFTGDNSLATSTPEDPDSCFGVADDFGDDRGWWEGFELLDTCTRVRVDLCCTAPPHFAPWPWLTRDCDCLDIVAATTDPNVPSVAPSDHGQPFCAEDNLWMNMGLLPPGHYYYSVRSALSGTLWPYTMHVVAEACPDAACCLTSGECVTLNQLECDSLGGFFLGLPNKFPATPQCVGEPPTCGVGACCTSPSVCEDEKFGVRVDQAACIALGGTFIGGIRCFGGMCAEDDRFSCEIGIDCFTANVECPPGTACCVAEGGARSLSQPNPCPVCELEEADQCQPFDFSYFGAISDLSLGSGITHADDFIPNAGFTEIDQVCVWGFYTSTNPDNLNCAIPVGAEHFRVRVFANSDIGLPGNYIGESTASSVRAETRDDGIYSVEWWVYQLTLDTPITGLLPGEIHWLEVANDIAPEFDCYWSWSTLSRPSATGNKFSAGGSPSKGYRAGSESLGDTAWCLPGSVTTPETPVRPSCACSGACYDETLVDAVANNRFFQIKAARLDPPECSNFVCPYDGTPVNDDFENALEVPVGYYTYETFCATTDGLPQEPSELTADPDCNSVGMAPIALDVWYKFTAAQDCQLSVSQCALATVETGLDAVLGVYTHGTSECPDPRTEEIADATRVHQSGCAVISDEDCCSGGLCGGPGFVTVPATAGQCFTIRAAAFAGQGNERGRGIIDISCGPPICGDGQLQPSAGEDCDGDDLGDCAEACHPAKNLDGTPNPLGCTCATATCGNGLVEGAEECDGSGPGGDDACPGTCNAQCECVPVCGNSFAEPGEDCDGSDDDACPGRCEKDKNGASLCTCPAKFCGNDFKDPGEECDGTDDIDCPDACRQPFDPAGGCTCACITGHGIFAPGVDGLCETGGGNSVPDHQGGGDVPCGRDDDCGGGTCIGKEYGKVLAVVIPAAAGGNASSGVALTAFRVTLTSLYHPSDPQPVDQPDYSGSEGEVRYLNLLRDDNGDVVTDCVSSSAFGTTYPCVSVGCEPEFADWVGLFGGSTVYVSGNAIIPDSTYTVVHLAASCEGNEAACTATSLEVAFATARFGDTEPNGAVNVTDIVNTVDVVKQSPTALWKYQVYVRNPNPAPHIEATNVTDIVLHVDALKLVSYVFPLNSCP